VARLATRYAIGQPATTASLSVHALALAQGVLTTMMIKKLTIAGCVVLSLGIAAAGGGALLARASQAQDPKPAPAGAAIPARSLRVVEVAKAADIDPQLEKLLAAARERTEAQRDFYEEGRITIDRFLDCLEHLQKIQLVVAKTDAERMEVRKRHVSILAEIENREIAEVAVGRGTASDVTEARQRHLEAEYELKNIDKEAAEKSAILRRLGELERKVDQLLRERAEKK
jgi:hypothetical protein